MISIDPTLISQMAERGARLDNRKPDEYRSVSIEPGIITSAEGSARVQVGNTKVLAGIKMDVGTPFPDTPNEGVLMVGAEFVPLASPDFEGGPPGEEAIELARVVDRAIRESKIMDVEKLCITPGEKVWMVFVDIDVLDHDGNLIDAASIAAMAALKNACMPKLDANNKVIIGEKTDTRLPLKGTAISTTFIKIGNVVMADPSLPEMEAMEARLTVGTFDTPEGTKLSSMQKGGPAGLTAQEVDHIIGMAIKRGDEIRQML